MSHDLSEKCRNCRLKTNWFCSKKYSLIVRSKQSIYSDRRSRFGVCSGAVSESCSKGKRSSVMYAGKWLRECFSKKKIPTGPTHPPTSIAFSDFWIFFFAKPLCKLVVDIDAEQNSHQQDRLRQFSWIANICRCECVCEALVFQMIQQLQSG